MAKIVNLEHHLKQLFNYDTFHKGQKEIIKDVLNGYDVLGVLPTGSGKSLCYQLPAKLLPGTTIVISPLISLMVDQVKQLKSIQYKDAVALNSLMSWQERRQILQRLDEYSLVYMSPELLQDDIVLNKILKTDISLFVVDEAHCVSQWGYEFRTDYLRLQTVIKKIGRPPILALSATAPEVIQHDIISSLNLQNVKKHIYPIDRKNIAFIVEKVNNEFEKVDTIVDVLKQFHVPTLIYFLSRKKCEEMAIHLSKILLDKKIAYYHGGMDSEERIIVQQQFMNDQLDIICCTSAFGMGINKENIRLIIHYHLPVNIESFIQEVGRAGRDQKESISITFYTENDIHLPLIMIERELPNEEEINYMFQQLYSLYLDGKQLVDTELELINMNQLSEMQFNFLIYQLENYGIIKQKKIYYDKEKWKNARKKIIKFKNKRLSYKQHHLNMMIDWVKTTQCLREALYLPFQQSFHRPSFQCCSNCHFSLKQWNPVETYQKESMYHSWQEKLARILLIGENDEARRHN